MREKMGNESKFAKSLGLKDPLKLGFSAIAGCFVITLMYFTFYDPYMNSFILASNAVKVSRLDMPFKDTSVPEKSEVTQESGSKQIISHETKDVTRHVLTSPPSSKILGERKNMGPICDFSSQNTNVCEMEGDIRIQGSSSLVIYATKDANHESWKIKPYARKTDKYALVRVREVTVKSTTTHEELCCDVNHSIPGIIFSTRGYAGNFFHDISEILIPLFITSRQYDGEVQFLASGMNRWWIRKYNPIFDRLSNYEIIDFDNDNRTHCFQHAIVGLRYHKELRIIPSQSLNGYSTVDFTKFLRDTYSLDRNSAIRIKGVMKKKPRLLIISRKRTRRFVNVEEIVEMAHRLGFKTVIAEAGQGGVANFARIVNSCDVMIGVHGAGLTNVLFLPPNGVFIQVTPLGGLDWVSRVFYAEPAIDSNLKYLQYKIKEEESTLIDLYPRDHPVFTNTSSISIKGWRAVKQVFLDQQNVRLDVNRFKGVLLEALEFLHED